MNSCSWKKGQVLPNCTRDFKKFSHIHDARPCSTASLLYSHDCCIRKNESILNCFFLSDLYIVVYFYGLFIFIRFVVCQVCHIIKYRRIPVLHVNPCTSNLLQPQRHHLGLVLFSSWARFTQGSSCFGQCQSGTTARAGHCILL